MHYLFHILLKVFWQFIVLTINCYICISLLQCFLFEIRINFFFSTTIHLIYYVHFISDVIFNNYKTRGILQYIESFIFVIIISLHNSNILNQVY